MMKNSQIKKIKIKLFLFYVTLLAIVHHDYSNIMKNRKESSTTLTPHQFQNLYSYKKPTPKPKISYNENCTKWDIYSPCKKLWQGDSLSYIPTDYSIDYSSLPDDITVVISYCKGDVKLFMDYIKDISSMVTNLILITRCEMEEDMEIPADSQVIEMIDNRDTADYSIAKYLEEQHPEGMTLFLNERSFEDNQFRSIRRVLMTTMGNGFGCVRESPHPTHSMYHDTTILRTFRGEHLHQKTFGHWLDDMHIQLNEITPVCYTSSFAIKSSLNLDILSSIKNSLEKNHVDEYAERVWGGLFSNPLMEGQVEALRENTYFVIEETCCLTGSLVSDNRKKDNKIPLGWK